MSVNQHSELVVQDEAVRYIFYLNHLRPDDCLKIIQIASKNITRYGLPNLRVIRVLFPVVMLLLIQQYRHSQDEQRSSRLESYIDLLKSMLKKVLFINDRYDFLFGAFSRLIRTFVVKALKQYVQNILNHNLDEVALDHTKLRITTNSLEEYSLYFILPDNQKNTIRKFIPYLNRLYGSLLDLKDEAIEIYSTGDVLSIALINFVVMGRVYINPDIIFEFYKHIYSYICSSYSEDFNLIARTAESISHSMYSVLDRQKNIKDEWLFFVKELVISHLENTSKVYEYGVTSTKIGKYIYFTPMYYGAIWNRVYPNERVDLLDELFIKAKLFNDRSLLLYVINSMGERATNPLNYKSILASISPYLDTTDLELRENLIRSLATIRNKNIDQVDNFLEVNKMRPLGELVKRRSYEESITELGRRLHEFIVDFMADADENTIQHVIKVIGLALDAVTVDNAIELAIKEIINRLINRNAFWD